MKYLPTIDIWAQGIQQAMFNGALKLQRGQWMTCGPNSSHKCRYIGHTGQSINAVHWQGSGKATRRLFNARIQAVKKTNP